MNIIYCNSFNEPGTDYIGQSTVGSTRPRSHLRACKNGTHRNKKYQATYDKLGDNFYTSDIICSSVPTLLALEAYERFFIKAFDSCDNGLNNDHGKGSRSKETRALLSVRVKAALQEPTIRAKISEAAKRRIVSKETRQKLSDIRKGKQYNLGSRYKRDDTSNYHDPKSKTHINAQKQTWAKKTSEQKSLEKKKAWETRRNNKQQKSA